MLLTQLALSNVRNYEHLDLVPEPGLNLFFGANAQGKSNLLEAIGMLGTGKSFRAKHDGDVLREGMALAVMRGAARLKSGNVELVCTIARGGTGTRKTFTLNGHAVRYARFLGTLRVVTFVPADLHLASGAPGVRRAFLNAALAQDQSPYFRALAQYGSALAQKNALLRSDRIDEDLLGIYNATLVDTGSTLVLARDHFIRALSSAAASAHARFSGQRERLSVTYAPNVPFEAPTREAIAGALSERLRAVAAAERARGASVAGAQRDDIELLLDGRALGAYGSQGQQRTAVLALKVAEYAVMRERAGEAPLLLLDDVLSELDAQRSRAFLDGVGEYEQAFVTSATAPQANVRSRCWAVSQGRIAAVAC